MLSNNEDQQKNKSDRLTEFLITDENEIKIRIDPAIDKNSLSRLAPLFEVLSHGWGMARIVIRDHKIVGCIIEKSFMSKEE